MKVSSTLAPGGIAVQPLQQQRHADAGQSRHAQVQKHRAHHHGAQREAVVEHHRADAHDPTPHDAVEQRDCQLLWALPAGV